MNMMPFVVSWAVLACVVLGLAAYRKMIAAHEDDYLHVDGGPVVQQQEETARRLDVVDKWGKIFTIIIAVYGLIIGALFMYSAWINGGKIES